MPKACPQKQRLLQKYQSTIASYSAAVTELLERMNILSKDEFNKVLQQITEGMLQDVAAARLRLQAHIYQHRC